MKRSALSFALTIFLVALALLVWAYPSHFAGARTGAPGELTCAGCHGSLNSGGGSISITCSKSDYSPGDTLTITVKVRKLGQQRWGFELTPLNLTMHRAGTLISIDTTLTRDTILPVTGRTYIWQNDAGTYAGIADSAIWSCRWVAPSPAMGPVSLFACGVAANNNDSSTGDYCFSTFIIVPQSLATAVDDGDGSLPDNYSLAQNYPNPFNPSTQIDYVLSRQSDMDLSVYNIAGQWIAGLQHGQQSAGQHSVAWNGVDADGRPVASGVYFYRLRTAEGTLSKKMMLVK